jgi:lipopolysaccharide/colanic/teichoic acid biosynthesis glycosyltransferase
MRARRHDRVMRAVDVVAACVLLVLTAPVAAAVAVAVRLRLGSPVLFRQLRAGRHGEPFTIHKFRTMLDEVAPDGRVRTEEERLTPLGAFLRRASLDELPQLVDVLRGAMALVGPRPLYVDYVPLYTPMQARRLEVRPGITGLAQVSGRNELAWERRLALDVQYVDSRSVLLDLRVLALTARRVLSGSGVTQTGHATNEMFTGSHHEAGL